MGWVLTSIEVALGIGVLGVSSLAVALYIFQSRLLYFPSVPAEARTLFISPKEVGLYDNFEEVFINTDDGVRLQAYFVSHRRSTEVPTILFFHGNAGNLSFRLQNVARLVRDVNVNVLIISYRGYGKSDDKEFPSEEGLQKDALAALSFLKNDLADDIDTRKIFLFGRSLGGAVAIYLASQKEDEIAGLIVENTFTSIPDMIGHLFPIVSFAGVFCKNNWRSIDKIVDIHVPTMFLSGEKDELVPAWMMSRLHEECSSLEKALKVFPDGMHMNTHDMEGYYGKVSSFIEKISSKL